VIEPVEQGSSGGSNKDSNSDEENKKSKKKKGDDVYDPREGDKPKASTNPKTI